jgi:hypothetical protein
MVEKAENGSVLPERQRTGFNRPFALASVLLSGSYLPKAVPLLASIPREGREEGIPFPLSCVSAPGFSSCSGCAHF